MNNMRMAALAALVSLGGIQAALADDYPNYAITMSVPFAGRRTCWPASSGSI